MNKSSALARSLTPLVYEVPFWDKHQWVRYVTQGKSKGGDKDQAEVISTIEGGAALNPAFPRFALEVFHRLYSWDNTPLEKLKPEAQWAVNLQSQLSQNQDFQDLQEQVCGNYFLSGLAATSFLSELLSNLPQPDTELTDPQELRDQVIGMKRQGVDAETVAVVIEEGKAAVEAMKAYAEQVEDLNWTISQASRVAESAVEEAAEKMYAFGWGNETGEPKFLDNMDEKIKLMGSISKAYKLKEIAKQAGRLKRIAAAKQRSKSRSVKTAIEGVETGNDLAHLLPSEYLHLKVPSMRPLFAKAYHERSLLQYKLGGKEKLGLGPVVVCLDSSGSMEGVPDICRAPAT